MSLRALIVEDEAPAREHLRALCSREGDIQVLDCVEDARQAVTSLARLRPDLLFLDVQLRGSSAFDVLSALPDDPLPLVVFTTAYAEHAVAAFEHAAVDYLLKPFSDERFRLAAARARERAHLLSDAGAHADLRAQWLEMLSQVESHRAGAAGRRLLGERQQRFFFLDPKDVESAVADRNYVTLTAKGETYLARISMRQLEARLEGSTLMRIHKSLMINLDHVRHMERAARGSFAITLHSGAVFRSSPVYRQRILARTSVDG